MLEIFRYILNQRVENILLSNTLGHTWSFGTKIQDLPDRLFVPFDPEIYIQENLSKYISQREKKHITLFLVKTMKTA